MLPGPDAGAVCSLTWTGVEAHEVLAAFPDGSARFWRFMSATDVAGTFHLDDDAGLASLLSAAGAARVEDRPSRDPEAHGGLRVKVGGAGGWASPESWAALEAAAAPLREAALAHPVRAIRVAAAVLDLPAQGPTLSVTVKSIGTEPAVLTLDPERIHVATGDGTWTDVPPPRLGLVDAAGTYLDGVDLPATVAPGALGAWLLNPPNPADVVELRFSGTLVAAGPEAPDAAYETAVAVRP